jgi:PAS domain S-box-containing protein
VKERPPLLKYGAAVLATIAAVLLRLALGPFVADSRSVIPFITFFPAVLFASWYAGFRAGLLSVLLSALAADYFFVSPVRSFRIPDRGDQVSLVIFIAVGLALALLGHSQRQALARAERELAQRRRAEEAERTERSRLETTLRSVGDAVISTDAEGRIAFVNPVAQSLLRATQGNLTGKHLNEVFHIVNEFTRKPVENPVTRVLREGAVVGLANHTVLIALDGTEVPIDDSAAPIRDEKGTVRGTVLVFRDITARRRAEASTRLLASVVESSDDGIISKDLNGIVTTWNKGAERIFGYSAEEIIGKPISLIAAPDRPDEMPDILARIKKGERIDHYETLRRTKSGAIIDISLTVSPVYDAAGQIAGASKIVRDITERKKAEERLRLSEAQARQARDWLQTTLASIGDAVIATDAQGRVTLINDVAQSLTGWTEEKAAGLRLEEVFVISNAETGAPAENPVSKALREGRVVGLANHTRLSAKDGRRIPIDDSAAPIRDPDGKVTGVVLVFRDITERKKTEDAVQQSLEELRRSNEDLNHFAFAASHDLQEPLRMITSYSQLLLQSYNGPVENEAAVCVNFISEGTKRMRALLADLLAYTQVNASEQRSVELIDVNRVFQKAIENLETAIADSKAVVTSGLLPSVAGQEAHFIQLFQNLIGNAIKYRGEKTPRIHVSAAKQDGVWRFAVSDNGIGVAPEYHQKIFGVFKRLHGKNIPGTGIGLAICQRVVHRYGGRIWVESQAKEGATFCFTLPAGGVQQVDHA